MDDFRTVDLFCGGGGLSQGLSNAGFNVVAAFDHWTPALEFYNRNIVGHQAFFQDLANVSESIQAIKKWHPTVIVGGPPCQDFSSAGKRDETGGRANLTISYAEIVCGIKPSLFIMENVDRALKTKTFELAQELFRKAGYALTVSILDASLCGVPQKRKRVVVIGILNGTDSALVPVIKSLQADKPMTVRDYLGDRLGLDYYYRHPRSYLRRGVFSIDEPSPTIRGVNRPIPKGYTGHDGDVQSVNSGTVRPLTTKERSLIQTFPSEWDISGKKSELEQIIGNAVPVKLAEFVGKCIKRYFKKAELYDTEATPYQTMLLFEQRATYK